ncbi:SLC24A5 [Acanthosepion pharaonis]|uniref:SLC24A5 n=1 Tax=Acanthosepion pharaonis TaxID=158019 RepID=A0A812B1B4_ACAPH|nr:SLC24A5 [Sepia pharaonis]
MLHTFTTTSFSWAAGQQRQPYHERILHQYKDDVLGLSDQLLLWQSKVPIRQLMALPNCTPPAVNQFPRDLFTQEQRKNGALVIHVLVAAYMFLGLSVVCDDYFIPSLESISEALHLQTDVAGATFMAAGSSAPELATSIIGVFVAKNDIGLGTVVGSAVYNILFVISLCALFAGATVHLNWWPLFRDCSCYTLSIITLLIIILDEIVTWYEALVLVLLYMFYILLMYFNPTLEQWALSHCTCLTSSSPPLACKISEEVNIYNKLPSKGVSEEDVSKKPNEVTEISPIAPPEPKPKSALSMPSTCLKRVQWVIMFPIIAILYITIPDCRKTRFQRCYLLTFIMSVVWLSVFSFLMVWMITVTGYTLGIPDTVMGLTFVAFGVSVPDAITSLIVAREGYGDMAISNAVGSNVFDILLCMGFPWLLSTLFYQSDVPVYSEGLTYSVVTLLSTVLFLILATHFNGWKLSIRYGGRQMCYNCQYTITSTKQGIECASEYNNTINSGKCPYKCIIHSETNKETEELRSYFRGCGKGYTKNGCSEVGNIETCYYTCTDHFCNGIDIRPSKNNSLDITIDKSLLFLIYFVFVSNI